MHVQSFTLVPAKNPGVATNAPPFLTTHTPHPTRSCMSFGFHCSCPGPSFHPCLPHYGPVLLMSFNFNITARGILLEPKSRHSPSFAQGPSSLMSVSLRIKLKTLTMATRPRTTWPHLSPLIPWVPPPGSQAFFLSRPTKLISNCLCLSCSLQLEGTFPSPPAPSTVRCTE